MTTSSAAEPETEKHHFATALMDGKASSTCLHASTFPALTPFLPASSPTEQQPMTPTTPHETEFATATGFATTTTMVLAVSDNGYLEDQGATARSIPATTRPARAGPSDSASMDSRAPPSSADSGSQSASAGTMIDESIGQQSAASYVPNGTHDSTATSTSKGCGVLLLPSASPQPRTEQTGSMQRENEEQENVTSASSTRTPSLNLELDSTSVDMDTSVSTPARHTPTPPPSDSSSEQHNIMPESSPTPNSGPAATKRRSLSPGHSMASLRDISAAYNNHQDLADSAAERHERLYGLVDRWVLFFAFCNNTLKLARKNKSVPPWEGGVGQLDQTPPTSLLFMLGGLGPNIPLLFLFGVCPADDRYGFLVEEGRRPVVDDDDRQSLLGPHPQATMFDSR